MDKTIQIEIYVWVFFFFRLGNKGSEERNDGFKVTQSLERGHHSSSFWLVILPEILIEE